MRKFGKWIGTQADGFLGGLARLASTPPRRLFPSNVWDSIVWVAKSATWAFGTSTPIKMILASFSLLAASIAFSWSGVTLPGIIIFGITGIIGFLRLIPAVDRVFVSTRDVLIP